MILPREVKSGDIFRGKVFDVALPFTNGRPLDFIIPSEKGAGLYEIVKKSDGFEGKIDEKTGRRKSEILKVMTEFKLRPCLIIQKDEFNQNAKYPFVVILPLATVTDEHKKKSIFKNMVDKNDIEQFYYIGNDCYITVNDPKRVYKNMLFEREKEIILNDKVVEEIMKRFAQCFAVKKIVQCDACIHNCENCQYRMAVSQ